MSLIQTRQRTTAFFRARPWYAIATVATCLLPSMSAMASGIAGYRHPIVGGEAVERCDWASVVATGGCTGTLIHPKVAMTATHCGGGRKTLTFGETSRGSRQVSANCKTSTDGRDWAYCILDEEVTDVPIVPAIYGCEVDLFKAKVGMDIVGVGFGQTGANSSNYGTKRWVATPFNKMIDGGHTIDVGNVQKGFCFGDSGGPIFIEIENQDGSSAGWRMLGQTHGLGTGQPCAGTTTFSVVWDAIPVIEQSEGIDVTPCFDSDGSWNPGPDCRDFPTDPGNAGGSWPSCNAGPLAASISTCGPPADDTPPTAKINSPADGTVVEAVGDQAEIEVTATANDLESGIEEVELYIDGVSYAADPTSPYQWQLDLVPGVYDFQVVATDGAGNLGESAKVRLTVLEDSSTESTSSGTETASTSDTTSSETASSSATDTADTSSSEDDTEDDSESTTTSDTGSDDASDSTTSSSSDSTEESTTETSSDDSADTATDSESDDSDDGDESVGVEASGEEDPQDDAGDGEDATEQESEDDDGGEGQETSGSTDSTSGGMGTTTATTSGWATSALTWGVSTRATGMGEDAGDEDLGDQTMTDETGDDDGLDSADGSEGCLLSMTGSRGRADLWWCLLLGLPLARLRRRA